MLARAADSGQSVAIINLASCASSIKGIPNRYIYSATKGAVIALTKSIAVDFAARGVRCNAICPGPIRTPSWNERIEAYAKRLGSRERALEVYLSKQPIGRVGEAREVAALALYLASDDAEFMAGAALPLDGGLSV
jgi:2-keto-3-deoxy-L-fuconate dehydrogenase